MAGSRTPADHGQSMFQMHRQMRKRPPLRPLPKTMVHTQIGPGIADAVPSNTLSQYG